MQAGGGGGGGSSSAPRIAYTDINVASGSGGDQGHGAFVRIFGVGFGATQGSSTLTMGGGNMVTSCTQCSWSDTQIIAQVGSSAVTGNIVVTNGSTSNGVPFTVATTNYVFVSPSGNDSTGTGSFAAPYATWRKAFNSVTGTDNNNVTTNTILYFMPGFAQTTDDGRGYSATAATDLGGSSATKQLQLVAYPGGTATFGSTSVDNGIKGYSNWITIADLKIIGRNSTVDQEAGQFRMVNNDLSCPSPPSGLGGTACLIGETQTASDTWAVYGNTMHDTGGNVDKTYHAVYWSSGVNHMDFGWNTIGAGTFKGYCRGVMFHATTGNDLFDLHVHDNIITNSYCDGLAFASVNPGNGTVEAYNNLIYNVALASNPYGVANETGIAVNTDNNNTDTGTVQVYNNTIVNAGAYITGGQNGCFGVVTPGAGLNLENNICSQPSSSQPYIEPGSTGVTGNHNLWYGAGTKPSFDATGLSVNPLFTSTTNFSLQSGSPGIGTGNTTGASVHDILGMLRASPPSIGAYEQ